MYLSKSSFCSICFFYFSDKYEQLKKGTFLFLLITQQLSKNKESLGDGTNFVEEKRTGHLSALCNANSWKETEAKIFALKIYLG